jgi:formylglycine-generating enzyme required for sulfatase activity
MIRNVLKIIWCMLCCLSVFGLSHHVLAQEKTLTNSIGMEFVLIPAGEFLMGSDDSSCPKDDPFTEKNEYEECLSNLDIFQFETPRHKVVISKPFYMGK